MTRNDTAGAAGDPLTSLMAEHAELRRLLAEVKKATDAYPSHLANALPELHSALLRHARREEEVLYALCAPRLDGKEGAIGVLRADHQAILRHADALSGPLGTHPGGEVRTRVDLLARSLHEHMNREELVLFPFVRILLSEAERGRLAHRLEYEAD